MYYINSILKIKFNKFAAFKKVDFLMLFFYKVVYIGRCRNNDITFTTFRNIYRNVFFQTFQHMNRHSAYMTNFEILTEVNGYFWTAQLYSLYRVE